MQISMQKVESNKTKIDKKLHFCKRFEKKINLALNSRNGEDFTIHTKFTCLGETRDTQKNLKFGWDRVGFTLFTQGNFAGHDPNTENRLGTGRILNFSRFLHMLLEIMAFPVVEFSRQGYKIRKVFG